VNLRGRYERANTMPPFDDAFVGQGRQRVARGHEAHAVNSGEFSSEPTTSPGFSSPASIRSQIAVWILLYAGSSLRAVLTQLLYSYSSDTVSRLLLLICIQDTSTNVR